MNVVLWVLQIVGAVAFLGAGATKVIQPRAKLQPRMGFVEDYSDRGVKAIGAAEVLGAFGLILPWATGIAKILTPLAAVALALVMVGAIITHLRRKEGNQIVPPAVLLVVAAIIAIGRF